MLDILYNIGYIKALFKLKNRFQLTTLKDIENDVIWSKKWPLFAKQVLAHNKF